MPQTRAAADGDEPPAFRGRRPSAFIAPQQTAVPSSRRAHVNEKPLLTVVKRSPSGGEDLPYSSEPQHTGRTVSAQQRAGMSSTAANGGEGLPVRQRQLAAQVGVGAG